MRYLLKHKRHLIIRDIGSVTSASTRCHSTVANRLRAVAACLCSTPYSPDKGSGAADCMGGLKERARKRGEWGIVILSTHTITPTPSQTQRFKLTHLAFKPAPWEVHQGRVKCESRGRRKNSDKGAAWQHLSLIAGLKWQDENANWRARDGFDVGQKKKGGGGLQLDVMACARRSTRLARQCVSVCVRACICESLFMCTSEIN